MLVSNYGKVFFYIYLPDFAVWEVFNFNYMKYLWLALWLILAIIFAWIFYNLFQVDEPITRFFTWVYLVGVLLFMIPTIYYIKNEK